MAKQASFKNTAEARFPSGVFPFLPTIYEYYDKRGDNEYGKSRLMLAGFAQSSSSVQSSRMGYEEDVALCQRH